MAIDMPTLKSTITGDPESKLAVKRGWLAEVYRLLVDRDRLARENEKLKARLQAIEDMAEDDPKVWGAFDKKMDATFGKGGKFEKIFGKRPF